MFTKKNAVLEMPADAVASADGGALEYAGFWARFAALLVDSAILTVFGVVLIIALTMAMGATGAVIGNIVWMLAYLLYWPVMESSERQATIGKSLLGIQVTDLGGNRTSFVRALLRNLAKIISAIPLYIGFLLAAFTGRKQALHDMITGCLVVRAGPSSLMKAVVAAVGGIAIAGIAGGYYVSEILPGQLMGGMEKEMDKAMKGAQKDMQRDMEKAMKSAGKDIAREMEKAMKEAEKEMKKEMEKAAQEAQKGAPSPPPAQVPAAAPPAPAPQKPASVALAPTPAKPAAPAMKAEASPKPAPDAAPSADDKPKPARRVVRKPAAPPPMAEAAPAPPPRTPKYNDVMTAVMSRDQAGAAEVLALGFWADRPASSGVTPLMVAAMNGDAAIAQLLLKHGADPNRSGPGGSVLDYALRSRDGKVIELLKKAGAR